MYLHILKKNILVRLFFTCIQELSKYIFSDFKKELDHSAVKYPLLFNLKNLSLLNQFFFLRKPFYFFDVSILKHLKWIARKSVGSTILGNAYWNNGFPFTFGKKQL